MATSRGVDRHLGGRNRDVKVKHLVTQPGTVDEVNKVSEGLVFKHHKGLQRTQTLNSAQHRRQHEGRQKFMSRVGYIV